MKFYIYNKAFTLIEIMVVVIIIGILTSIAVPFYQKTMDQAKERDVIVNLRTISSASIIYNSVNSNYWPPDASGWRYTGSINNALGLNIKASDDPAYRCDGTGVTPLLNHPFCIGGKWTGTAYIWAVRIRQNVNNWEPCCASEIGTGVCPTLPACP